MKRKLCFLICFLMGTLFGQSSSKILVVTTLPDLASIAKEVGGDKVEVISLAKGYQDPHYVTPTQT